MPNINELTTEQIAALLEQGRKDADRLDYLNRGATVELVPQGAQVLAFRVSGLHCTVSMSIRAAIDAAMDATPEEISQRAALGL